MIDTHSHIYSEEFDEDREQVIIRALEAGVDTIFLPAIDKESYARQEELAASRPQLFHQMMGLHPTSVGSDYLSDLEIVKEKLFNSQTHYVAVGEIGLDFYWDTTYREEQIDALKIQMQWAEQLALPTVLHLRSGKDGDDGTDAYKTMFKILNELKPTSTHHKGIMHCFSGTIDDALQAIEIGFMIGIGGVVTYKKSTLPEIVRQVGLSNIVLETDSPYLAPIPFRGRRNESAYVRYVAEKVAEITGTNIEEVDRVTTENAKRVFLMHGNKH